MSLNKKALEKKLLETRLRLVKGDYIVEAEGEILESMAKTIESLCVSIPEGDIIVDECSTRLSS